MRIFIRERRGSVVIILILVILTVVCLLGYFIYATWIKTELKNQFVSPPPIVQSGVTTPFLYKFTVKIGSSSPVGEGGRQTNFLIIEYPQGATGVIMWMDDGNGKVTYPGGVKSISGLTKSTAWGKSAAGTIIVGIEADGDNQKLTIRAADVKNALAEDYTFTVIQ